MSSRTPPAPGVVPPSEVPEGFPPGTPAFARLGLAGDYEAAVPAFLEWMYGPGWRTDETALSHGALEQLEQIRAHLPIFFQNELFMYEETLPEDYYRSIRAPTAVVLGEKTLAQRAADPTVFPELEQQLELIPSAERVELPDADHFMLRRKPEETAAVIGGFIGQYPIRGR